MHDLEDIMDAVQSELAREYDRIMKRVQEDPGTAGDQGEENWAEFIRGWLPPTYSVVTKGRILAASGEASPQVDILVLKPSYPPALRSTKVYLAGGVAAAFECKTTLRREHIKKAFETSRTIHRLALEPKLLSHRNGSPYLELNSGIMYGVLAHSHSWRQGNAKPVNRALWDGLSRLQHPRDALDVLCIADFGSWTASKTTYFGPALSRGEAVPLPVNEFPGGCVACAIGGLPDSGFIGDLPNRSFRPNPLAQLCAYLTTRLAWEDPSMRSIAEYFSATGMPGMGIGRLRTWELEDVYSVEVTRELRAGRVEGGRWNVWGMVV